MQSANAVARTPFAPISVREPLPMAQVSLHRPPAQAASVLQQLEAEGIECCQAEMKALREQHALWFYAYEDADPDTAGPEEVLALLQSAPDGFAKGLIFGKFTLRMQIAAITGRGF
jgi:hypothetical protein